MLAEGRVGSITAADGSQIAVSFDKHGGLRVSPDYSHESRSGGIFYASVAVGGVDHQASFTTTAPAALWNDDPSIDGELLAISFGYVSGTLGGGFLGLGQYLVGSGAAAANAPPTGTLMVARGTTRLGGGKPRLTPLETVTLTAGATLVSPVKDIAPKLATTAAETGPSIIVLPFPVVIPYSTAAVLAGVCGAAGAAPRVTLGFFWREVNRPT